MDKEQPPSSEHKQRGAVGKIFIAIVAAVLFFLYYRYFNPIVKNWTNPAKQQNVNLFEENMWKLEDIAKYPVYFDYVNKLWNFSVDSESSHTVQSVKTDSMVSGKTVRFSFPYKSDNIKRTIACVYLNRGKGTNFQMIPMHYANGEYGTNLTLDKGSYRFYYKRATSDFSISFVNIRQPYDGNDNILHLSGSSNTQSVAFEIYSDSRFELIAPQTDSNTIALFFTLIRSFDSTLKQEITNGNTNTKIRFLIGVSKHLGKYASSGWVNIAGLADKAICYPSAGEIGSVREIYIQNRTGLHRLYIGNVFREIFHVFIDARTNSALLEGWAELVGDIANIGPVALISNICVTSNTNDKANFEKKLANAAHPYVQLNRYIRQNNKKPNIPEALKRFPAYPKDKAAYYIAEMKAFAYFLIRQYGAQKLYHKLKTNAEWKDIYGKTIEELNADFEAALKPFTDKVFSF